MSNSHKNTMFLPDDIRPITLITTGRTGTDFFQSLLDGHESIATLNGHIYIYEFLDRSKCLKERINSTFSKDIFYEFYWSEIDKFKSEYDQVENKSTLGVNQDQSINIDPEIFANNCFEYVEGEFFNTKSFVLAVNHSYSICIGQDVSKKKILFYHYHHPTRLPPFLSDFPGALVVAMTRDPRANFCSSIYNWMKFRDANNIYRPWFRDGQSILRRLLMDYKIAEPYSKNILVIKLEDLGDKEIMRSFCSYVGIDYSQTLTKSTWAGLLWNSSDRVSSRVRNINQKGFDSQLITNNWKSELWWTEKYLFNTLLNTRLKEYSYSYNNISYISFIVSFFIVLIPFKYELIALSPKKLKEAYFFSRKEFVKIPLYYLTRIILCYKFLFREIFKMDEGKFSGVLLKK